MANCAWRFNSRLGVAYLESKKLVEAITDVAGKHATVDKALMATYFSPGGKPFAWQVLFDMVDWEMIAGMIGIDASQRPVRSDDFAKAQALETTRARASRPAKPTGRVGMPEKAGMSNRSPSKAVSAVPKQAVKVSPPRKTAKASPTAAIPGKVRG